MRAETVQDIFRFCEVIVMLGCTPLILLVALGCTQRALRELKFLNIKD